MRMMSLRKRRKIDPNDAPRDEANGSTLRNPSSDPEPFERFTRALAFKSKKLTPTQSKILLLTGTETLGELYASVSEEARDEAWPRDFQSLERLVFLKLCLGKVRPYWRKFHESSNKDKTAQTALLREIVPKLTGDPLRLADDLNAACELYCVGPATASFLLALKFPTTHIFAADPILIDVIQRKEYTTDAIIAVHESLRDRSDSPRMDSVFYALWSAHILDT